VKLPFQHFFPCIFAVLIPKVMASVSTFVLAIHFALEFLLTLHLHSHQIKLFLSYFDKAISQPTLESAQNYLGENQYSKLHH